jgi:hypothetical protein
MHRAALFAVLLSLSLVGCGKKASTTPQPVVADAPPAEPEKPIQAAEPEVAAPPDKAYKATPSDAELKALFARTLEFLEQFANAVAQNEADCKKMAKAMTTVFDANQELLAEAKAYEGNQEVDAKVDAYMQANKDRFDVAMSKMMKGMQACASDTDVQKAMESFDAK